MVLKISGLALASLVLAAAFCLFAPPAPSALAADQPPPAACRISGMVYCTEYGAPYNENPYVVFEGAGSYKAELSISDGRFSIEVPSGHAYDLKVRFSSGSFLIDRLQVPLCEGGPCGMTLDIHYPGSMLEMMQWASTGHSVGGITYRLKPVAAPDPASPVNNP